MLVATASADVAKGIYRGSSQTTVKFLDPVTLAGKFTQRYSRKLTVSIGKPLKYGDATEANPFDLAVAPTTAAGLTAGDFVTASARIGAVQGQNTLLQYWVLQNTQSGFTGTFTNSHELEGLQRDRLVAPFSTPTGALKSYRFYDGRFGAVFQVAASGLVTGPDMNLEITGYAHVGKPTDTGNNAIISFRTLITAKKR